MAVSVPMQAVSGSVHPLHVLQCMKGEQQFEQWHPSSCPDSSHCSPFSQNRHLSTRNTGMVESAMTIIANIIDRCFIYYQLFVLPAKLFLILIMSKFFCFHFWLLSCVICYRRPVLLCLAGIGLAKGCLRVGWTWLRAALSLLA